MGKFTCLLFQTFLWCTNVFIEDAWRAASEVATTIKSRFKSEVVVDSHYVFRDFQMFLIDVKIKEELEKQPKSVFSLTLINFKVLQHIATVK